MFKTYKSLIFGIIILAILAVSLYYTTQDDIFSIHNAEYDAGNAVVLSIQPPRDQSIPPAIQSSTSYIADGTLFLFIKNHNKLFFLPSFQQMSTFSPTHHFHADNPIFAYLYIGRYKKSDNTISYRSFKQSNVHSLYFFKKCLTGDELKRLLSELKKIKKMDENDYLNTGMLTIKRPNEKKMSMHIGHWIYKRSILNTIQLKQDKEGVIDNQFKNDMLHRDKMKKIKKMQNKKKESVKTKKKNADNTKK
jgi:hypothetical protein